jgi:sugar phosphate isomerase/epimerase
MKNELEGNIKAMEISKFLGAKTVICFAYGSRSQAFYRMDKEAAKRLIVKQLCKFADAANGFGLRVALALGSSMLCGILPWTCDWKPIIEIVETTRKKTGLDNIGVVLDVKRPQFLHENILEVTKFLAPFTFHGYFEDILFEDGVWKGCMPGEGPTPWKEIIDILNDAKCDAVLSLDNLEITFPDFTYLPRSYVKECIVKAFEYMRSLGMQW